MGIIKYILYSRYRPLNLIETIFVSFLNLFYIKKYKQISFHIFRQKRKPAATVYYNNLGRIILYLVNIFFIIIFNKFLLRNIFFSRNFNNVISREKKNGDDFSHWPRISISKQCISSNNKLDEEIEHKCNIQLNLLTENKNETLFWKEDRKNFKKVFLNENNQINFEALKNFRSHEQKFNSLIFNNESLANLGRKNKIRCLNLINLYHKIAEKSKIDLLLNCTDNDLGNPNFLVYRNQIINERLLR